MNAWTWIGLAGLLASAPAYAGRRFESLMIDRIDKTATLGAPLGLFSAANTYFDLSENAGGSHIVDLRDGDCRGVFDFSPAGPLLHRARTLAVLEGAFGRVYGRFDYWYPPAASRIAVNTAAGRRNLPHREPRTTSEAAGKAESFALIRVLRVKTKYRIATADYGLDGGLMALRVDISSGDWSSSEVAFSSAPELAARLGLPASINPTTFPKKPFAHGGEPGEDVEIEAALIYRARGLLVERIVRRGSHEDHDMLAFPRTDVELPLVKTEESYPLTPGPGR